MSENHPETSTLPLSLKRFIGAFIAGMAGGVFATALLLFFLPPICPYPLYETIGDAQKTFQGKLYSLAKQNDSQVKVSQDQKTFFRYFEDVLRQVSSFPFFHPWCAIHAGDAFHDRVGCTFSTILSPFKHCFQSLQSALDIHSNLAVVDLKKVIHVYAQSLAIRKAPQEEIDKNQHAFIKHLDDVLSSLSEEKKVILLKPEALVHSRLQDYTHEVINRIQMREGILPALSQGSREGRREDENSGKPSEMSSHAQERMP